MYNITLVSTCHSELGKCNSEELFRIIESVKPYVIFEELTQDLFDKVYKENINPNGSPEILSVKKYIKEHNTCHIPVDISINDTLSTGDIYYMFNWFKKYVSFSRLEEEQVVLASEYGYSFLNSKKSEEMIEEKKSLEKDLIGFNLSNSKLFRIYQLFYEEQHSREHEIIKNIYNYSEINPYNQALLLLGSGHRKAIIEKVKIYEFQSQLKLNWVLYGN